MNSIEPSPWRYQTSSLPESEWCSSQLAKGVGVAGHAGAALVEPRGRRYLTAMAEAVEHDLENLPKAAAPPDPERFWHKLKRSLARIPFAEDLVAAYYCALDPDTPPYVRAVLAGALAYFMLPMDVVPDLLAGLGFTDDASVLAAAIAAIGRHMQPKHRTRARAALDRLSQ